MEKVALITGIINGFLSVALGAFGAHGLRNHVAAEMLTVWQTGVMYQFFHALALIAVGLWLKQSGAAAPFVYWAFTLGIVFFSGSLYVLVLSGIKGFGAVTPIGGLAFLVGWAAWAWTVIRN